MNTCQRRANRRAFSLIEVITVTVIIGTVAAIALPRFSALLVRRRLDAAALRVMKDIDLVRTTAESQSKTISITFDATGYDLTGVSTKSASGDVTRVNLLEETRCQIAVSFTHGGSRINVDGYGRPDNGGTITLSSGERSLTLTVDEATGRVTRQ